MPNPRAILERKYVLLAKQEKNKTAVNSLIDRSFKHPLPSPGHGANILKILDICYPLCEFQEPFREMYSRNQITNI